MADGGKFLLRLAVGGLLLFHGIHKVLHGIGGVQALLEAHGWPQWMGYGVYFGEVLAPIALVIGWHSRIAAAVVALNMVAAIYLGYGGRLLALDGYGGWVAETPFLYLAGALAIAMFGGGRIGLKW